MGQNEVLLRICWGTHWELENHVGKLIEILMGAHRELDRNTLGTNESKHPSPPSPKEKKLALLGVCDNSSLDEQNFYY
jgi:hypothetical protein